MSKGSKIVAVLILLAIAVLTYLEASAPKPINWFPSYAKTDKIPMGTFITYQLIKQAIGESTFKEVNQPPYEFIKGNPETQGTYFFVNGSINFDESELDKLLDWVEKGNTLFVSSKSIASKLLDTLDIETSTLVSLKNTNTKPIVSLTNSNLKKDKPYVFDRDIENPYFSKLDSINTHQIGLVQLENDSIKKTNYIKKCFGNGNILLHTFPEAFSNYFVLKDDNFVYTQNLLGFLPNDGHFYWDNYYKDGKTFFTSPLYLLLSNQHLKWAYYFILIATLLFILFKGKRKQRSIPIIKPLKNQTLSFTRTISNMYLENDRHDEIAKKQQLQFLEFVRDKLRIPTLTIDSKTIKDIASKTDNSIENTEALFNYFDELNKKQEIKKEELMHLYKLISKFKNNPSR